jgi:hypothetical protein
MAYKKGERVKHPTKYEWGVGQVLADSAPVFDSYARKWLISLDSELKRAPTRGSSAGFDWVA